MLKVAIIGAGPGGCVLARLLTQSKKDIQVTVFESEQGLNFRSQGGTLDIRGGSGLDAIKAANLWEEFKPHARYDGESLKLADKNLLCYLSLPAGKEGASGERPEVDRPVLRRLLFESLPEGIVEWSHKLTKVDEDCTLHFTDKPSRGGFDLVVGADGAWSHTRALLTDVKPVYSGISGHQMVIPNAARDHKELYDLVNRGSVFAWSDGKAIMPQQMGDGSLSVGLWSRHAANWQTEAPWNNKDPVKIREMYAEVHKDWDPRLVAYTQQPDCEIAARDLYMLPVGTTWKHKRGVTLIGDAAHLATPFAGIGVNTALTDALVLSKAIIAAVDEKDATTALDKGVKDFEDDMFKRGHQVQEVTYKNMQMMFFSDGTPNSIIEKFILNSISDEFGWFTYLVAPIVYAYYFWFRLWHRQ